MEPIDHATQLGKVVANLLSLEFLLRAYLYEHVSTPSDCDLAFGAQLESLSVGDEVTENAFTSFDTLRQLIAAYNTHVADHAAHLRVDERIVNLRDAIAHGRVSAPVEAEHLRLIKFSNPRHGALVVLVNEELNPSWFTEQIRWTRDEMLKVADACSTRTA